MGLLMSLGHYQHVSMLEMTMKEEQRRAEHFSAAMFKQIDHEYIHYGQSLLGNPELIEAFAAGDRKRLLELSLGEYERIKDLNPYLYVMHYHTPDTHSFLRVHKPQKFGDDLSSLRFMIVATNEDRTIHTGFERGKFGIYYRITFPVYRGYKYIGAFEFGIDVKYFLSKIEEQGLIKPLLLINKETAAPIFEYSKSANDYLVRLNSEFSAVHYASASIPLHQMIGLLDDRIYAGESSIKYDSDGEYLLFRGSDLKDYTGQVIGHFVFVEKINYYMDRIDVIRWISIMITLLLLIVVIALTYSLIRRYTDSLVESESRLMSLSTTLSNVLQGANLGYWDWHIRTHEHHVNDRWLEMLGLQRSDIRDIDTDWSERIHPDDKARIMPQIIRAMKEDISYRVEFRMRHKAGHYIWIEGAGAVVSRGEKGEAIRLSGTHQDITLRKTLEEESQKNRYYRDALFAFNPNIIVVTNGKQLIDANRRFFEFFDSFATLDDFVNKHECVCELFEYREEEEFLHPDKGNWVEDALESDTKKALIMKGEKAHYFSVQSGRMRVNEETLYMATMTDITHEHDLQEKLLEMTIVDPLTQVYNRRHFNEVFEREVKRAHRDKLELTYMMLDIDHFKSYNDNYGHDMGDEVLREIASAMQAALRRPGDYLFRLGGEEFGILLNGLSMDEAAAYAHTIKGSVESLKIDHRYNAPYMVHTISIGLYFVDFGQEEADTAEIYRMADRALYEAKEGGRNQVVSYGP